MKKTIKEWYKELPEPIRIKAISNFTRQKPLHKIDTLQVDSLIAAISCFRWKISPEGYYYWYDIITSLDQGISLSTTNSPKDRNDLHFLERENMTIEELYIAEELKMLLGFQYVFKIKGMVRPQNQPNILNINGVKLPILYFYSSFENGITYVLWEYIKKL